jgi:hypothetical protein
MEKLLIVALTALLTALLVIGWNESQQSARREGIQIGIQQAVRSIPDNYLIPHIEINP